MRASFLEIANIFQLAADDIWILLLKELCKLEPIILWQVQERKVRVDVEEPLLATQEVFAAKSETVCRQAPVRQAVSSEHMQLVSSLNRALVPTTEFDDARIGIQVEDIANFGKNGYNVVVDQPLVSELPHEVVLFAVQARRIRRQAQGSVIVACV